MLFVDRKDAGQKLCSLLLQFKNRKDTLVIGLPRGGVVVANEVASLLNLPLDVICPRKVGCPFNPELALGAVTHSGEGFLNQDIISQLDISEEFLKNAIQEERARSQERYTLYRKGKKELSVEGKTVLLIDDGLATGATMKAAIEWTKGEKAKAVVVAVPVGPPTTLDKLRHTADAVFSVSTPSFFQAVGQFYQNFEQITDEEVLRILQSTSSP